MNISFNIEYRVNGGEYLLLCIENERYAMQSGDGYHWHLSLHLPDSSGRKEYCYEVWNGDKCCRQEWELIPHVVVASSRQDSYTQFDRWSTMPEDSYRYSSAFKDIDTEAAQKETDGAQFLSVLRLKVRAPQLNPGQRLAICGDDPQLGSWSVSQAVVMQETACNEWSVALNLLKLRRPYIEFKFLAISDDNNQSYLWEECSNRSLSLPVTGRGESLTFELDQSFYHYCNTRLAGTLVAVFSLRSRDSFGVGDFGDLKKMIDWVSLTGQRVLQVLPINDSTINHTWRDSYPYSCISITALHPQYVNLKALPPIADTETRVRFDLLQQELNALPQIDYERVNNAKLEYLRIIFGQEGRQMIRTEAFRSFFQEEQHWLVPYAQYCVLREQYGTADFSTWPDHKLWDEADREKLSNPRTKAYREAAFYYFVQFVLQQQMIDAHQYARSKRVVLKGDIPIGVHRLSCDVWQQPRYFNLNGQAGAPPDDFAVDGQNWGFPTYNWDVMLRDDCQWWVRRFQNMQKYFDAYRIDHVLGFFRIWEIPVPERSGLQGQFSPALPMSLQEIEQRGVRFHKELFLRDHKRPELWHPMISAHLTDFFRALPQEERTAFYELRDYYFYRRHNQFWHDEAMKKLPKLVSATRMLVCAEDLGMVPESVEWVMNELKILSLEIQTMPKEFGVRFGNPQKYPYRSVCTISSHDMATMRMWWDEDHERAQQYFQTMLNQQGQAPHPMPGWVAEEIINQHLLSPSMLCVISIQDWLAIDENLRLADANAERINIPAIPDHYWRYRMHLNIEDLLSATDYNRRLKRIIAQSGRES